MEIGVKIFHDTVSLVAIIDPIAAASILLSMVPEEDHQNIKRVAFKSSSVLFISSLLTVAFGDAVFRIFGIGVDSIKVVGGIVLLYLSLNMIHGNLQIGSRHSPEESHEALSKEDISVIPLGIPILYGPGVIATLIILKVRSIGWIDYLEVYSAVFISCIITYVILRNSPFLMKLMGITGFKIVTRIMGLIVGAIAVQFVVSGIKALWFSL